MNSFKSLLWLFSLTLLGLGALNLACNKMQHLGYGISYQVSNSMPKGWYGRVPLQQIHRDDWVLLYPPVFAEQYLLKHHWLPHSGILLKSIQALPGDWVCQKNHALWINGQKVALILTMDLNQHPITSLYPRQHFCRRLLTDEYMVLGLTDPRSYDSRYFGPVNRKQILSKAVPLFIF